jgi:hypothetical protein
LKHSFELYICHLESSYDFKIGLKLNHSYIEQRDYVLMVTIKSELSSQVINYDIYVWEDISNVTLVSNRLAGAFEIIAFTFDNI